MVWSTVGPGDWHRNAAPWRVRFIHLPPAAGESSRVARRTRCRPLRSVPHHAIRDVEVAISVRSSLDCQPGKLAFLCGRAGPPVSLPRRGCKGLWWSACQRSTGGGNDTPRLIEGGSSGYKGSTSALRIRAEPPSLSSALLARSTNASHPSCRWYGQSCVVPARTCSINQACREQLGTSQSRLGPHHYRRQDLLSRNLSLGQRLAHQCTAPACRSQRGSRCHRN